MIYDRYYYSILLNQKKQAYNMLYRGIMNCEKEICISDDFLQCGSIDSLFSFLLLDNPMFYYVDLSNILFEKKPDSTVLHIDYPYTPDEIESINGHIQTNVSRILERATGKSDYEKELSLHDILVRNVTYDNQAYDNLKKYHTRSNTILGVFLYKTAVCEGIAKAMKLLLNAMDIKCIVATGDDLQHGVPHAWNIVKIGGNAYHLDVTWDLNMSDRFCVQHDYFNLTDTQIVRDHRWTAKLPQCSSTEHNYFSHERLIVSDIIDALQVLADAKRNYQASATMQIRETASQARQAFIDEILLSGYERGIIPQKCRFRFNEEQGILSISL